MSIIAAATLRMSANMSDIFGIVVERIDADRTHLGLPDTRNLYHQVQLTNEQLIELRERIDYRLWQIEQEEIMQRMRQKSKIDEKPRANYPASLDDWERIEE